jgi:uncharacterized protein YwgA
MFELYSVKEQKFMQYDAVKAFSITFGIPMVPELYRGPYSMEAAKKYYKGKSSVDGKTMLEGIVVRRINEDEKGRASLKLVSEDYKLRNGGTEFH